MGVCSWDFSIRATPAAATNRPHLAHAPLPTDRRRYPRPDHLRRKAMNNITITKAVLEQALDALQHGITEMNYRNCTTECMPLHHASKALREARAAIERQSVPADASGSLLGEIVGCFDAAIDEGLFEAIDTTTDERLKDLLQRRIMHAYAAAIGPSKAAPQPPRCCRLPPPQWRTRLVGKSRVCVPWN